MKKKLLIWGASGHAKVVADIVALSSDLELVGFVDDVYPEKKGRPFAGGVVLGGREQLAELLSSGVRHIILGFGNNEARLRLGQRLERIGFELATAIHPSAVVAQSVKVGLGTVIMAGAVVNPDCVLGRSCIVNTNATIDHDCALGDGVHISPGACLGGAVSIGQSAWIGIGATVRDHISIGAGALIGAGSVVVKDIPGGVLAYGCPASIIRERGKNPSDALAGTPSHSRASRALAL